MISSHGHANQPAEQPAPPHRTPHHEARNDATTGKTTKPKREKTGTAGVFKYAAQRRGPMYGIRYRNERNRFVEKTGFRTQGEAEQSRAAALEEVKALKATAAAAADPHFTQADTTPTVADAPPTNEEESPSPVPARTDLYKPQPTSFEGVFRYVTATGATKYGTKFSVGHRREVHKRGFKTAKAASRFRRETLTDLDREEFVLPADGKITVNRLNELVFETKTTQLEAGSKAGWKSRHNARISKEWGDMQVRDITRPAVQSWINRLHGQDKLKRNYIEHLLSQLRTLLAFAVEEKMIRTDPTQKVKLPKKPQQDKSMLFLTFDDVIAISSKCTGDNGAVVLLLAYTAMRWGELAGLRVGDVDLESGWIRLQNSASRIHEAGGGWKDKGTKSDEERDIPLGAQLIELLKPLVAGKEPGDLVFPPPGSAKYRDAPCNPTKGQKGLRSRNWLHKACLEAGVAPITAHRLRKVGASLAVQAGSHIKNVQTLLGHADPSLTLKLYTLQDKADLVVLAQQLAAGHAAAVARSEQRGESPSVPSTPPTLRVVN